LKENALWRLLVPKIAREFPETPCAVTPGKTVNSDAEIVDRSLRPKRRPHVDFIAGHGKLAGDGSAVGGNAS
jgi:hypothetical protein